jgi:hypothetical protein
MKFKTIYPHITDTMVVFYAVGEDDEKVYSWNPKTGDWEIFKVEDKTS